MELKPSGVWAKPGTPEDPDSGGFPQGPQAGCAEGVERGLVVGPAASPA